MKKSSRVVSTLLLGATVASASTGVFAVESNKVIQEKLAGETRFETAVQVSEKFGESETVVLVNYTGIADALAATPLAKMKNAPILLTEAGSLTKATADQIEKLKAKNIIIIGGTAAVSENVEKQLKELGKTVERIAGADRYITAVEVAKNMGDVEKVAVVNGINGLADALSIAAPAAKEDMAIILSNGQNVEEGKEIVDKAKTKYAIGGQAVLSDELVNKIGAERIAGDNRNETNAEVLNKFYSETELDKVYVAKDGVGSANHTSSLVDALAAGPLAGKEAAPVMLVGSELAKSQEAYLKLRTAQTLVEVGNGINQNSVQAIIKALEVKDVEEEAKIVSAKIINAGQIQVNFNKNVDKDSAETIDKYTLKGSEDGNLVVKSAKVKNDGKAVILTLDEGKTYKNQQNIDIKVENILAADKVEKFPKFETTERLLDTEVPVIKEVKQVGPRQFDLVFNEPVKEGSKFDIQIKQGNNVYTVANKEFNYAENTVTINTGVDLADGAYNLQVGEGSFVDFVGLKSDAMEKELTVKKDTSEVVMSEATSIGNVATINFNKKVKNFTNANVKYYLDYVNEANEFVGQVQTAEGTTDKIDVKFNKLITPGKHKVIVKYADENEVKIEDLWGNKLASGEIAFEVENDTTAPTVSKVEYKDSNKIEVDFSKNVKGADDTSAYELKNSKGEKIAISNVKYDASAYKATLTVGKIEGVHNLVVKGDKITDTTINENKLAEASFEIVAPDKTPATIKKAVIGGENQNKMTIEYSEAMKTSGSGSILDKSLYEVKIGGQWINLNTIDDAKIELIGSDSSKVKVTLPEEKQLDATTPVRVGPVQDLAGNTAPIGETVTIEAVEKDAVTIEDEANVVDKNKLEIITEATIKDVSKIKVTKDDDTQLNIASYDVSKTDEGKTKLTLTFTKVDNNDNFTTNPSGNIKVKFEDGAAITELGTSKGFDDFKALALVDKISPEYVKDSAKAIKNAEGKLETVELSFSEKLKGVNEFSFEVEGFKVKEAACDENGKVILTLDTKSQEEATNLDKVVVKQVAKITDANDNEIKGFTAEAKVEAKTEEAVVTTVEVAGQSNITIPGADNVSETYIATVKDQNGAAITGQNVVWSVTSATGVTINPSTGELTVDDTAIAGTITVTATVGTVTGTITVTLA
ncbi:cell wall-binding repeat-containing protein [Clostridium senegalense]